jgi:hypothetical protein
MPGYTPAPVSGPSYGPTPDPQLLQYSQLAQQVNQLQAEGLERDGRDQQGQAIPPPTQAQQAFPDPSVYPPASGPAPAPLEPYADLFARTQASVLAAESRAMDVLE